jgi:hypothetical protein
VTQLYTGFFVRVRIKYLPSNRQLEGFDLQLFEVGQLYDVGPRLGELLIVSGYAVPETSRSERDLAADMPKRPQKPQGMTKPEKKNDKR